MKRAFDLFLGFQKRTFLSPSLSCLCEQRRWTPLKQSQWKKFHLKTSVAYWRD